MAAKAREKAGGNGTKRGAKAKAKAKVTEEKARGKGREETPGQSGCTKMSCSKPTTR